MQRELETAGFSTIIHTPIPEVAASVNVPRISAIEYPLGRTFGHVGDKQTQQLILTNTLRALETITTPGEIFVHNLVWAENGKENHDHPVDPPPIVKHIMKHPLQVRNLLKRQIPN